MSEPLKQILGQASWANKAGLNPEAIRSLASDFLWLESSKAGLLERTLGYLLDGEDAAVSEELATIIDGTGRMRLRGCDISYGGYKGSADRTQFFRTAQCSDAGFWRRLAEVYDLASIQSRPALLKVLGPDVPDWFELFLCEAVQVKSLRWGSDVTPPEFVTMELLERMLVAEGLPAGLLIHGVFLKESKANDAGVAGRILAPIKGFAEACVRHGAVLRTALSHGDLQIRTNALSAMREQKIAVEPFLENLVDAAVSKSKTVRERGRLLMEPVREATRPLLEKAACDKRSEIRAHAVELLSGFFGTEARDFLEKRLAEEKTKSVADLIRSVLAHAEVARITLPVLPPVPPVEELAPLGGNIKAVWSAIFERINTASAMIARNSGWSRDLKPVLESVVSESFEWLQRGGNPRPSLEMLSHLTWEKETKAFIGFWKQPELKPIHLVRFLSMLGEFDRKCEDLMNCQAGFWVQPSLEAFRETHDGVGLREWATVLEKAGGDPEFFGRLQLSWGAYDGLPLAWSNEEIWPYWSEHVDLLLSYFNTPEGGWTDQWRRNVYAVLATFPQPPTEFAPLLWEKALAGPKAERPLAQRSLDRVPDRTRHLLAALGSGLAERRAVAADWIRRIREKQAREALLAALKKEGSDSARGAIMAALEAISVPVDQFLDREELKKEAAKGMAKGIPEGLRWFPFGTLPAVHWSDNGAAVPAEIVSWWLVQHCKLKSPAPGPLLRRYCAGIRPNEREELGRFILAAWIGGDPSLLSQAEAEKKARAHADSMLQTAHFLAQYPQPGVAPAPVRTLEEYYEEALALALLLPKGSVIEAKGILAVAGACVGAEAAEVVQRYLKEWYGMRTAQCRALLQMLAWIEHPSTIQVLFATGSRFRTKGIQEEANIQIQALAERKGWSIDELSDRTIPTAGLNAKGVLSLDFGTRQFHARLDDKLQFSLFDSDNKQIKALPEPRKEDDAEKAAWAKKQFGAAKKELKALAGLQVERLYEAMCTGRVWRVADWSLYLNQHPVVRHFTQRLVWALSRADAPALFVRPLPDGSLTDAEDNAVEAQDDDQLRIAHQCHGTEETARTWQAHFTDYNIVPLFEQFGKPVFKPEQLRETEVCEFEGYLLEAFKLRGRLTKLGYIRGQPQDGGWFFEYYKRFSRLGLQVTIDFSGNSLPEENRQVALRSLSFSRVGPGGSSDRRLKLDDIPAVLLSECWNDLRMVAAEGTGFDAEWESRIR